MWIPQLEGFEATTGPDGRYVLSRIPAGTHYVRAEALGYQSQGRTIDVAAGEVSDVSWHLEEIPFDEAFSRIQEQRGTLGCGVGFRPAAAGTNAVSACGAAQLQQQGLDRFLIKWSLSGNFTRIAGAAMEMEWQTTQALGAGLELRWEGFGCNINTPAGADGRIATLVGRNPLGILYNDTAWADRIVLNAGNGCNLLKCTTQCQLQTRVFPAPETLGPTYPADVGIVLQQTFKQYFSEFYVEPPPADHSALPDA
ncbi:MAG: carboxypeptidase regulatory-like domain-containing protein [Euryarchaeota archaeon]|nr:carboxypeptidase regulatory-like domain-containing protein [Euryarchaeota archaeon]